MSRTSNTAARPPVPDIPDHIVPVGPFEREQLQRDDSLVLYLAPLWQRRRLLGRTAIYGLLASVLFALLIPTRYESTARLMPPDDGPSGGLAIAAAALAGGNGGNLAGL